MPDIWITPMTPTTHNPQPTTHNPQFVAISRQSILRSISGILAGIAPIAGLSVFGTARWPLTTNQEHGVHISMMPVNAVHRSGVQYIFIYRVVYTYYSTRHIGLHSIWMLWHNFHDCTARASGRVFERTMPTFNTLNKLAKTAQLNSLQTCELHLVTSWKFVAHVVGSWSKTSAHRTEYTKPWYGSCSREDAKNAVQNWLSRNR